MINANKLCPMVAFVLWFVGVSGLYWPKTMNDCNMNFTIYLYLSSIQATVFRVLS